MIGQQSFSLRRMEAFQVKLLMNNSIYKCKQCRFIVDNRTQGVGQMKVIGFRNYRLVGNRLTIEDVSFKTGGATVVDEGFAGNNPGDHAAFVADMDILRPLGSVYPRLMIFAGMRAQDKCCFRKAGCKTRQQD